MRRLRIHAVLLLTAVTAAGQTLTPRELFYSDPQPVAKVPAPPRKKADKPKTAPPVKVDTVAQNEPAPRIPTPSESTARDPGPSESNTIFKAVANRPLGLKYSVQKLEGRTWIEADPDTTFVAGDHIRLAIESNDSGYLYVVTQGSSGAWAVRHPSPGVAGGSDQVQREKQYFVPPGAMFTFDEHPGSEKLFIVLSREKEADLERLIYSLQEKQDQQRAKADTAPPMLAMNTAPVVDDALVSRMREMYGRDLVIEKIDEASAPPVAAEPARKAPQREKATYVVNPSSSMNTRVVADIALRHK